MLWFWDVCFHSLCMYYRHFFFWTIWTYLVAIMRCDPQFLLCVCTENWVDSNPKLVLAHQVSNQLWSGVMRYNTSFGVHLSSGLGVGWGGKVLREGQGWVHTQNYSPAPWLLFISFRLRWHVCNSVYYVTDPWGCLRIAETTTLKSKGLRHLTVNLPLFCSWPFPGMEFWSEGSGIKWLYAEFTTCEKIK